MKLRNKKTGEIKELKDIMSAMIDNHVVPTLVAIENEWEDVPEEPKEYWYLSGRGEVRCIEDDGVKFDKDHKAIGNYFESPEEAELAVRKLKALKRLKDEGMSIYSFKKEKTGIDLDFYTLTILAPRDKDSLDILFGGEE